MPAVKYTALAMSHARENSQPPPVDSQASTVGTSQPDGPQSTTIDTAVKREGTVTPRGARGRDHALDDRPLGSEVEDSEPYRVNAIRRKRLGIIGGNARHLPKGAMLVRGDKNTSTLPPSGQRLDCKMAKTMQQPTPPSSAAGKIGNHPGPSYSASTEQPVPDLKRKRLPPDQICSHDAPSTPKRRRRVHRPPEDRSSPIPSDERDNRIGVGRYCKWLALRHPALKNELLAAGTTLSEERFTLDTLNWEHDEDLAALVKWAGVRRRLLVHVNDYLEWVEAHSRSRINPRS